MINILYILGGAVLGLGGVVVLFKGRGFLDLEKREKEATALIEKSKTEAEELLKSTKDQVDHFKQTSDFDYKSREERVNKMQEALKYKEESLAKKEERNNNSLIVLATEKEAVQSIEGQIERSDRVVLEKLSEKAGQSIEKLTETILEKERAILERDNVEKLKNMEERTKEDAGKIAKKVLLTIIQRLCSPTSSDRRAVHIVVPRDHIKGKIVGKDGQNIIFLEEEMPGVSIVFNDLPNTISVSCFNLVQRRLAQKTIEKLVAVKGEIDQSVIKKAKQLAEKEIDEELYEIGKKALDKMNFRKFDPEFVRIIGRLQYRTSYGQNIMKHSMEVGWVAAMIGSEIGLDEDVCKVAGFLHDVGKAIDQDPNEKDAHDYITKDLMEKFGCSYEETHAAWTHHDAIPQETAEALIIKAADAVSAGRPGARQESIFSYADRIKALEETALSFKGIKKIFTMAAGREIRLFVDPKRLNDNDIQPLAKEAAKKIEENVTYPGKIKVNVIRRVKYTETTKVKK